MRCFRAALPPEVLGSLVVVVGLGCDVEKLLWDATYVDTGAPEAPRGTLRTWVHVIEKRDAQSQSACFGSRSDPPSTTANNNEVIFFIRIEWQSTGHFTQLAKLETAEPFELNGHQVNLLEWLRP
jgi:hypothetical protein